MLSQNQRTTILELAGQGVSRHEISRTLQELDGSVDLPSSREWQEFSLNMEASLAGVPYESRLQQAKGNLVAAVQILSLRGQAWLEAQAQQRQLLTELYYNQQLQ